MVGCTLKNSPMGLPQIFLALKLACSPVRDAYAGASSQLRYVWDWETPCNCHQLTLSEGPKILCLQCCFHEKMFWCFLDLQQFLFWKQVWEINIIHELFTLCHGWFSAQLSSNRWRPGVRETTHLTHGVSGATPLLIVLSELVWAQIPWQLASLTYNSLSKSVERSQFLEIWERKQLQICRTYTVPVTFSGTFTDG